MCKCIALIGPPCSGKSAIGRRLEDEIGYKYISSGDIARKMASTDSNIGNHLNAGGMAPEDRMREEVIKVFDNSDIILDGFPRFADQYRWLVENVPSTYKLTFVMIDAPIIELVNRASKRGRPDDIAFGDRLNYYMEYTQCLSYIIDEDKLLSIINTSVDTAVDIVEEYLHDRGWI